MAYTVLWCSKVLYGSYCAVVRKWLLLHTLVLWGMVWFILQVGAVRYGMVDTVLGLPLTWASSNPNYSTHYCSCEPTFLWSPSWSIWQEWWWWRPWLWWGLVFKALECRFQTVSLFIPIWFQIYCPIKHKLVWQSNHVKNSHWSSTRTDFCSHGVLKNMQNQKKG